MRPTPIDGYPTPTSDLQFTTESILKARFLSAKASSTDFSPDGPVLHRNAHLQFLLRNLVQGFPARYISQDASQPWLFFWTLQGFSVLGVGLDEQTRKRCVSILPQFWLLYLFGNMLGQSILFLHTSIHLEVLPEGLGSSRTYFQRTPPYVHSQLLDIQERMADGAK
jgi:hypothetical protein